MAGLLDSFNSNSFQPGQLNNMQNMGLLGLQLMQASKSGKPISIGDVLLKSALSMQPQAQQQEAAPIETAPLPDYLRGNNNGYIPPSTMSVKPGKFSVDPAAALTSLGFTDQSILNSVPGIANSIAKVESSDNYGATGPTTKSGDKAYGRYQVMGNNIPVWSKEILGVSMTPEEFMSNPEAQDKIALAKMAQYHTKYGNAADVSSMWFSGRPARGNTSKDILGTSVPQYISRVAGGLS